MDPKILACLFLLQLLVLLGPASSDLAKDKAECTDKLIALGPCLGYVSGGAKAPTPDCCSGLKGVLDKSKKCLCLLVKDSNDPSLGIKINATLALGLPDKCSTPANISECPELLNLAPNSPDAKVFQDFVNSAKGSNTTSPAAQVNGERGGSCCATCACREVLHPMHAPTVKGSPSGGATSADVKSDGCKRKRLVEVNVAMGLFLYVFIFIFNL